LYIDDEIAKTNKLQQFINIVVTFAVLRLKKSDETEDTQPSQRFQPVKLSKKTIHDFGSDNQSSYSRFSQGTNRTTATAMPVQSLRSKHLNQDIKSSPSTRKLSDSNI
jgi:hypothetical protein